jgi:hypothetical protein
MRVARLRTPGSKGPGGSSLKRWSVSCATCSEHITEKASPTTLRSSGFAGLTILFSLRRDLKPPLVGLIGKSELLRDTARHDKVRKSGGNGLDAGCFL